MPDSTRRRLLAHALGGSLLAAGAHRGALAQERYPAKPIKWIVPYLAGTGPDTAARILAEAAGPLLGQPIVIDNRAGAAGNIGTRIAAKAQADGYTLLYTGTPLASNMHIYKSPGYDALQDFRHVMRISSADVAIVVPAQSAIRSVSDLVAQLQAQPGKLDYASGGVGTPSHLGMELFLDATHTQALHVPYKGASELITAILGRQVAFGMPIFAVAYPMVRAGKLRALATAGVRRNPVAPDVPTLAELGIPGVELSSWGGLSVPAGTPEAIVQALYGAFSQVLQQPKVVRALLENGGMVDVGDGTAFVRSIRQEMEVTARMMHKLHLEPI